MLLGGKNSIFQHKDKIDVSELRIHIFTEVTIFRQVKVTKSIIRLILNHSAFIRQFQIHGP